MKLLFKNNEWTKICWKFDYSKIPRVYQFTGDKTQKALIIAIMIRAF
jgi:hypothetical protein